MIWVLFCPSLSYIMNNQSYTKKIKEIEEISQKAIHPQKLPNNPKGRRILAVGGCGSEVSLDWMF